MSADLCAEARRLSVELQTILLELVVRYPCVERRAALIILLLEYSDPRRFDIGPARQLVHKLVDEISSSSTSSRTASGRRRINA
jgi:hypothetical protein